MPWRHQQPERRPARPKADVQVGQQGLLAFHGAAAKEHDRLVGSPAGPDRGGERRIGLNQPEGVKFQVARHLDAPGRSAQFADAPCVLFGLHQPVIRDAQKRAQQRTHPPVPGQGTVGDAAVDHVNGDALAAGGGEQRGPDLRFGDDQPAGPDTPQHPPDRPPQVIRTVEGDDGVGECLSGGGLSGWGDGGQVDPGARLIAADALHQRCHREHFADAHRVDPDGVSSVAWRRRQPEGEAFADAGKRAALDGASDEEISEGQR